MLTRYGRPWLSRCFAWHDVSGSSEGMTRYPKIILDKKSDPSRFLRRKILKEQDIKRFGKMGVSRTVHHGIPNLPDCEYAALTDVVDALEKARREGEKFIPEFFQLAGDRFFRDSDLLTVPEIITVLNEHCLANHFNLKLFNKLKNEIIYDSKKIQSFMEIGVVLNAFSHFNIISPKLVSSMMARGRELIEEDENKSPESIGLVIRSLCRCSKLGPKVRDFIGVCLNAMGQMETTLPVSDLALTLRILAEKGYADVPENLKKKIASLVPTDIDSVSNMVVVGTYSGQTVPEAIVQVIESNVEGLAEALKVPEIGTKTVESIEARNRAARILARLLIGLNGSNPQLEALLTNESVRGMRMHQLKKLSKMYPKMVNAEIGRRKQYGS